MVPEVIVMKPEEPNQMPSSFEKAKRRLRWKKLFAKKWFFPAVYVAVAAIILTGAWWYQGFRLQQSDYSKINNQDILPTGNIPVPPLGDQMILPVAKDAQAVRTMHFYEETGSKENKEASIVKYANTFWPHSGLDFSRKDGKSFDVVAALDGKVLRSEENPIVGYQVELEHKNGAVTVYQSLEDVRIKKGQTVKKGDVIARAGRNRFEKEAGIHLHFEVRRNNQPLNPAEFVK
jgi:stage II sporulation protein Q